MARKPRIPRTADPMSTRPIERRYEARLNGRVRAFGVACKDIIEGVTPRMLESAKIPPSYFDKIEQVAAYLIARQGQTIAAEELIKSFYNGQQYAMGAGKMAGIIPVSEQLSIQVAFNLPPNRETLEILNRQSYDAIKGLSDDQAKRVKYELTEGMLQGEDVRRLARRIDAVTDIGIKRSRVIAQDQTHNAAWEAAQKLYEQWGVETEEWITAKDERVCTRSVIVAGKVWAGCQALDGQKFPRGVAKKAHIGCRCALAPDTSLPKGEKRLEEMTAPELIVGPDMPMDAPEGSIWVDGPVRIRLDQVIQYEEV